MPESAAMDSPFFWLLLGFSIGVLVGIGRSAPPPQQPTVVMMSQPRPETLEGGGCLWIPIAVLVLLGLWFLFQFLMNS
jgi:hypothetical protein